MPAGNGMGPMGMGPVTGRGMGYCAGTGAPGYENAGRGPGMGRGRGFGGGGFGCGGRGRRNMFYATGLTGWQRAAMGVGAPAVQPDPEMEKNFLRNQAEALQAKLGEVRKRLEELEIGKSPK
ncbi:MAG: DUF5320 domain-containing protein [Planctomycetota bacterium]